MQLNRNLESVVIPVDYSVFLRIFDIPQTFLYQIFHLMEWEKKQEDID